MPYISLSVSILSIFIVVLLVIALGVISFVYLRCNWQLDTIPLSFEKRKRLSDLLPHAYYINLKHRTDRKQNIEKQLNSICYPIDKIHRVDAVYTPKDGALGCALSHLKAFDQCKKQTHTNPYILILEDDFMWNKPTGEIQNALLSVLSYKMDWDVILLSCNGTWFSDVDTQQKPNIRKVGSCQTASGYIVKIDYIPKLYALWKKNSMIRKQKCGDGISKNPKICFDNTIDQSWKGYQKSDKWYIVYPKLGIQLPGYSDIEKGFRKYNV